MTKHVVKHITKIMGKTQKISLFIVEMSLAHLLIGCQQPNPNNYENEINLCLVPTQEQSITKVSLSVPQVHLHARKEGVFQNILSCFMDQRYIYTI